jgi:hypothetical protein
MMRIIYLVLLTLSINSLLGQELIGASGGDDFSIGEVITTTLSSNSSIVTQGFQQPNLFGIGNRKFPRLKIQVYPNPTTDKVQVHFEKHDRLDYIISNSDGKPITRGQITNGSELSFGNLPAGQYFISLRKKELLSTHAITLIR